MGLSKAAPGWATVPGTGLGRMILPNVHDQKKKALWLDDAICQIEIKFQIIDELIDY